MFDMKLDTSDMERRLKVLIDKSPAAWRKAKEIGAIQFLTWANNGSANESRKPPIATGFLRGSSSAFVGGKLVGVNQQENNQEANRDHSEKEGVITWGWNADYATRMHETEYNLGEHSQRDGDSGNKWLEKHLKADRFNLMKVLSIEFKKEVGT